jgi:hypothetical protein
MDIHPIKHAIVQPETHLRFLESWLPLAEETSRIYGWDLDPAGLEVLILQAAPSLTQSRTMLEARLSLWAAHQRRYTSEG